MHNGMRHDRKYMVKDEAGNLVSQRTDPKLALVQPRLGGMTLSVTAPGMNELQLPYGHTPGIAKETKAIIHGRQVTGLLAGDDASQWFSDYLHKKVDVMAAHPGEPSLVKEQYRVDGASPYVDFADSFPALVTSEASLQYLNK